MEQQVIIDSYEVEARLAKLYNTLEQLPSLDDRYNLYLEYCLIKDFFRDKFRRSTLRRKKTEGRKIGNGQAFIN